MLFKSTAIFLTLLLAISANADNTVTHTNYIYPSGWPLPAQQPADSTGIKVVMVYENGCERPYSTPTQPAGFGSQSTVSGNAPANGNEPENGNAPVNLGAENTGYSSAANPPYPNTLKTVRTSQTSAQQILSSTTPGTDPVSSYTALGADPVSSPNAPEKTSSGKLESSFTKSSSTKSSSKFSSIKPSSKSSSKPRSTIYDIDTTTQNVEVQSIATASAVTTTKTIFSATVVPSTIYTFTSKETVTQISSDPLVTKLAVSKSLEKTLPTSYSAMTITDAPENTLSNATTSGLYSNGTATNSSRILPITSNDKVSSSTSVTISGNQNVLYPTTNLSGSYSNETAVHERTTLLPKNTTYVTSSYVNVLVTVSANNTVHLASKYANVSLSYTPSLYYVTTSRSLVNSTVTSQSTITSVSSVSATVVPTSGAHEISRSSESDTSLAVSSSPSGSSSSSTLSSSSSSSASSTSSSLLDDSSDENNSGDLFSPISTSAPISLFPRHDLDLAVPANVDKSAPFGTNKFYANLFLDDQTDTVWPLPYGLFWKKTDYYGFGVTRNIVSERVFGSLDTNNPGVDSYYYSPIGNAELIVSATDLTNSSNVMSVSEQHEMSVLVSLSPKGDSNKIDIPIVQGMGFVTAVYHGNLVAELNSLVGVSSLTEESSSLLAANVLKYRAKMSSGAQWLIYATVPSSSKRSSFSLSASDPYKIVASDAADGLILQMAFSNGTNESFYDQAAGTYVTDASVSGSVSDGTVANFKILYDTEGSSLPVVFALPHHQDVLSSDTTGTYTNLELPSNTKGTMKGYFTKTLEMTETLNPVGYLPFASTMKSSLLYTSDQLSLIAQVANSELAVDIASTVQSMGSNYYSGKVIDKYAYILLVVNEVLKDDAVTNTTLSALKDAFSQFLENKQHYPFFYDTRYKGVTTDVGNEGSGADFGSSYYNDHHFHFGYFVHAAAIVGYVDKKLGGTWADDNKDWVNSLIRDVANPSRSDEYFPVSRSFDWFHGHSWAAGLFASGDGKNEESSSEDYNFAYGMRLWGKLTGDLSMKSRGDLMLSIMSRAMNKYFYYKNDNTVEPSEIIPNKVSGILFENKIAYTTYFGTPSDHPEYVHGIHMLPITPASSLIRIPSFVQEEWEDQVSKFIDNVDSGWTGILRLNQALYDAKSSYDFFSSLDWKDTYLDNGQSRTWSLAFSAGVSNAS